LSIVDFPAASDVASDSGDQSAADLTPRLELRVQPCDGYAVISVWGELRAGGIDDLNKLLNTLSRAGYRRVLLDLSRLYDLDADAISELSRWQAKLASSSGGLWLAAPRPWVRRLLEHMCLRSTFTVYPTVLEALAEVTPSDASEAVGHWRAS
jgi:anti-anti-sigma regulatory factor